MHMIHGHQIQGDTAGERSLLYTNSSTCTLISYAFFYICVVVHYKKSVLMIKTKSNNSKVTQKNKIVTNYYYTKYEETKFVYKPIIILNLKRLNSAIKREKLSKCVKQQNIALCCLLKAPFK